MDAMMPGGTLRTSNPFRANRLHGAESTGRFSPVTDVPLDAHRCRSGTDERNMERRAEFPSRGP